MFICCRKCRSNIIRTTNQDAANLVYRSTICIFHEHLMQWRGKKNQLCFFLLSSSLMFEVNSCSFKLKNLIIFLVQIIVDYSPTKITLKLGFKTVTIHYLRDIVITTELVDYHSYFRFSFSQFQIFVSLEFQGKKKTDNLERNNSFLFPDTHAFQITLTYAYIQRILLFNQPWIIFLLDWAPQFFFFYSNAVKIKPYPTSWNSIFLLPLLIFFSF